MSIRIPELLELFYFPRIQKFLVLRDANVINVRTFAKSYVDLPSTLKINEIRRRLISVFWKLNVFVHRQCVFRQKFLVNFW